MAVGDFSYPKLLKKQQDNLKPLAHNQGFHQEWQSEKILKVLCARILQQSTPMQRNTGHTDVLFQMQELSEDFEMCNTNP